MKPNPNPWWSLPFPVILVVATVVLALSLFTAWASANKEAPGFVQAVSIPYMLDAPNGVAGFEARIQIVERTTGRITEIGTPIERHWDLWETNHSFAMWDMGHWWQPMTGVPHKLFTVTVIGPVGGTTTVRITLPVATDRQGNPIEAPVLVETFTFD